VHLEAYKEHAQGGMNRARYSVNSKDQELNVKTSLLLDSQVIAVSQL